ncbi:MAG: hypothetical protein ABII00_17085 [Elusimicrobiota bacterium]
MAHRLLRFERHKALREAVLAVLLLTPTVGFCQSPRLADDFANIMGWLTQQTADGLGFNGGSTFDPPNEMKPWRMQPDVSLGAGHLPFDKGAFPEIRVQSLAENDPAGMLPDKMLFPNLTLHVRLGLPGRMDLGVRVANMTTPKNYRLSESTVGNGQSNTVGFGLRKHFGGGRAPLLSLTAAYNHTFGYFNYVNEYKAVEITPGFVADATNTGQLEWDVRSVGLNVVASQAYGRWTPFFGAGYNRMLGSVNGRLEARWKTTLIQPSVGEASSRPAPDQARVLMGFQRDGFLFNFFVNGEVKALGPQAGRTFIVSTGFAAPFRLGAKSSIVRYGRNRPKDVAAAAGPAVRPQASEDTEPSSLAMRSQRGFVRENRRRSRGRRKAAEKKNREDAPQLIFIR